MAQKLALTVYPAVGYPLANGDGWRITFSGIAWRTPIVLNRRQQLMVRMLGNVMKATPEQMNSEVFERRVHPFLAEAFHKQRLMIKIGDHSFPLHRKTRRNGRFEESILIPSEAINSCLDSPFSEKTFETLPFELTTQVSQASTAGTIFLYPRKGLSIISDIDDTIKDSQVADRRELLANTFLRDFRAVEGMPEVYRRWSELGAAFHYVSSSPWQLYEALRSINDDLGFPVGTMHLRNFRLRDQLLKRFILRRKGKAMEIRKLLEAMPERDFILVGDSGEKDPKIYRKVCVKYGHRIRGVFIRNVGEKPLDDENRSKLIKALPTGVVASFNHPGELDRHVEQLLETEAVSQDA